MPGTCSSNPNFKTVNICFADSLLFANTAGKLPRTHALFLALSLPFPSSLLQWFIHGGMPRSTGSVSDSLPITSRGFGRFSTHFNVPKSCCSHFSRGRTSFISNDTNMKGGACCFSYKDYSGVSALETGWQKESVHIALSLLHR